MSQVFCVLISFYLVSGPINAYWILAGPVTSRVFFGIWITSYMSCVFLLALYGIEVCAIKYFQIVVVKKCLPIEDNFSAVFALRANIGIVGIFSMIYSFSSQILQYECLLQDMPEEAAKSTPVAKE